MTWYVVDGMDGCGKTTAGDILREELEARGRRVMFVSHPNPDCIWGRIEEKCLHVDGAPGTLCTMVFYITDVVTSLFRAKRRRKQYDDLVFVRYIMAVSYLPEGVVKKGYDIISHVLPMPDVKLLIDVDAETAMARIEARSEDREAFERVDKLTAIRKKMHLLVDDGWNVIDNTKSVEFTRSQILEVLNRGVKE